ncbi:glycosyltransferase family 4 protein [Oceanicaulis sp. LC35]|uniref:glycosyltransferase family 4 protein n=1 Tax=Oceanicaulis sp. LC35 TaxID=3349635 RepID=UPI003F82A18E
MRILVHDYAGHPFQAELSRALAARGHEVIHAYFAGDKGPKGRLERLPDDPEELSFAALGEALDYSKSNFIKRRQGDLAYGKLLADLIRSSRPDVVLSGNTPTETQQAVPAACRSVGAAFVYWIQDFYSIAADKLLRKRLPLLGHGVGAYYKYLDAAQMRGAEHVIIITDAFSPQLDKWGIRPDRVSVIPNWGALKELPVRPKDNAWSQEQGVSDTLVCLYTGTLAMKHDPTLLEQVAANTDAEVVVVAAGVGVEHLEAVKSAQPDAYENLTLLPLQPFKRFADVLGSADIMLAVIEEEAGEFSVPSKVLSYLCSGRPIVLSAPAGNLAARIVRETGAGLVCDAGDGAGFVEAVRTLINDPDAREAAGRAGRAYAEEHFDLDRIADRFESVLQQACQERAASPGGG